MFVAIEKKLSELSIFLLAALIFIMGKSAFCFSKEIKAKMVTGISSSGKNEKVEIQYADGHREVLELTLDQYQEFNKAQDKKNIHFLSNPSAETFAQLDERQKFQTAMLYLEDPLNSKSHPNTVSALGKKHFESMLPEDKVEVGIYSIKKMLYKCRSDLTGNRTCETQQTARIADIFKNIERWNKSDLERSACEVVEDGLSFWNPAALGPELDSSDLSKINTSNILLNLLEKSPQFKSVKNTSCIGFSETFKIEEKLMSIKDFLPSLEARAKKRTSVNDKPGGAIFKSCPESSFIQKLLEITQRIYKSKTNYSEITIFDKGSCAGAIRIEKLSANKYIFEPRNNLFMATGDPIEFSNDSELLSKIYGTKILKDPSVKS